MFSNLKTTIATLFFISIQGLSYSQITGIIDNDDIGTWAYHQHNTISSNVYDAINSGNLSNGKVDGKSLSKQQALKMFQQEYVAFISTNADDPTIGYDTSILSPITENYHLFLYNNEQIGVQLNPKSKTIYFNKKQFESILDNENKLYFKLFEKRDSIQLNQIPLISTLLNKDFNIRLHLEGMLPKTNLYTNESLDNIYSLKEKETRGFEEVLSFTSTNPNDPTQGRDSIYSIPLAVGLNDTSKYQFFYFSFDGSCDKLALSALSCGYSISIYGMQVSLFKQYGFIKYSDIKTINSAEKQALEFIILLKMKNALQQYGGEYSFYMDYFQLESKNDIRYKLKR